MEKQFASNLREAMKDRGLNQTQLSEKILREFGVVIQRQTISMYLNGQSRPDTDRLRLLCMALDVSADYLLGFDGKGGRIMLKQFIARMNREQFAQFVRIIYDKGYGDVFESKSLTSDDEMLALATTAIGLCGIDVFEDGDNGC